MKRQHHTWKFGLGVAVLASFVALKGCGKKKSAKEAVSEWLSSFASGFAISSPTALSSALVTYGDGTTISWDAPYAEKKEFLEGLAKASSTSACAFTLPTFSGLGQRAACYGPQIAYSNHPNCAGAPGCSSDGDIDTDDDDLPGTPNDTDGDDTLPTGDLGLWDQAESSGQACAAAQMDKLTGSASGYVDASLILQAASVCILNNKGEALPATGASVDFTSDLADAVQNPGATITAAKVTHLDGDIYQFEFTGTTDGVKAFSVSIRHQPANDENTEYKGRIYGYFSTMNKDAFAVTYEKASDRIKARMSAGSWQSSVADSGIFKSNGDLVVHTGFQGNMNNAVFDINTTDGTGNVSYAWQAGSGDDKTRVFNVYTQASGAGCGFFGYGNSFQSNDALNTNAISGFICNWAGVGNDHSMSGTTSLAQKQCFSKNSSGIFQIDSARNNIRYWPTVSCNKGGSMALSPYPDHNSGGTSTTNNLVNITSDSDYGSFSAPTAPSVSF